jgi:hypothetical protein
MIGLLRNPRPRFAVFFAGFFLQMAAVGQTQMTAPSIPSPGENHIPPNTRVIEGVVQDPSGTPVKGAIVLLKDTKTLQVRSYIAQDNGEYHFYGLSTDVNYQVRAQQNGLTSPNKMVSVFDSHQRVKVNLKLKNHNKS